MTTTVPPAVVYAARVGRELGLAAWLGGTLFGKFAHNPSVRRISSNAERGAVTNAAWNGYNAVNAVALGATAAGWYGARVTETRPGTLSSREGALARAEDVLTGVALVAGVVSGVQGLRLAKQAPGGAVPVETGTKPAEDTPEQAARIQRVIEVVGNVSVVTGIALVAVNAVFSQTSHSLPPKRRALTRRSR